MKRIIVCIVCILIAMPSVVFAHSGGTDSNGGHHDYNNVSGLGDYHYHHGYGPHLHENGVCPYDDAATNLETNVEQYLKENPIEIPDDYEEETYTSAENEETYTFTEDELFSYMQDYAYDSPSALNVVRMEDYEELKQENKKLEEMLEAKKWDKYDYGLIVLIILAVTIGYYKLYQWGKENKDKKN